MRTTRRRFATSTAAAALALGMALAGLPPRARAGHPMLSEDTGTQGTGNAELELGYAWSQDDGTRSFLFQPQLSCGVTPSFDVIVQPSWLANDDPVAGRAHGFGDSNLDVKWRFYGAAPLSLALRAGLDVATGERALGLPHGESSAHALLVATVDAQPFTLDANLGILRNPADSGLRTEVYHPSAAALFAASERLAFVLDAGADSNSDPHRREWPVVALAGAIYTVRPGLDVDIGYRAGLNAAAVAKQWLLGITYRWAP